MRKLISVFTFLILFFIAEGQTISPKGPTTICPGGIRTLKVNSVTGTTYQWYKKSGGNALSIIPGETNATYNVSSPGSYYVKVGGAAASDTLGPVVVTLAPVPKADFTFSPATVECGNTPITFTGTAGAGNSYLWQFGDPRSGENNIVKASAASVVHKFKGTAGVGNEDMNVKLVLTNSAGCKDSTSHPIKIKQVPGPSLSGDGQINFQSQVYFKHCTTTASEFTFTDQSNPAQNHDFEIIWGDGSAGIKSAGSPGTVKHTYNVGNYPLQFISTGTNGCKDTTNYGVFVGDAPNGGIGTENPILSGCSGSVFNFPFLPSVFANTEGTYYYLSVDDGTEPTVYSQPPPPSYEHIFNESSCGNGNNSSNFFTVSLVIKNPCNVSGIPGTIGGIKISSTPQADMILPNDTPCINQPVSLYDNSVNTYINESGECTSGKSVWSISPGVQGKEWNIISGNFGSEKGSLIPAEWAGGSPYLQVQFLKPGNYQIKIKTGGSNLCGLDSIVKNICVNPEPIANFSMSADSICTSLVDSVKYSPATEFCGKNYYEWTVSYTPINGCSPTNQDYAYVNGTNANSAKPHFKFNSPGIYDIQLIAYSPGHSCAQMAHRKVVVKSKPNISLPANGGVCQNQPAHFTSSSSCFIDKAKYDWSFPGSDILTSTQANPPPVTYSKIGNYDITLKVTNECGISTAVEHLAVGTIGNAKAGPDTVFCGNTITMAGNAPTSSASGEWSTISGPNQPLINNPSSPNTTISNLLPGTYKFQWKLFNNSCADSSIVSIRITEGPTAAKAGPDQVLCLDTATTFAANTPVQGKGKWQFISGPNQPVIVDINSPTSRLRGLIPGNYFFTWNISFSNCDPSVDTVEISIKDKPTSAVAGAMQLLCSSSTVLTANAPASGEGAWTLVSGPNIPLISSPELATTPVSGMISGTYFFRWEISNEPCTASSDTVRVVVSTLANNVISKDQSLCINTAVEMIKGSIPEGGNGNYSYHWQQSLDSGITWTGIDTAKRADFNPGPLSVSTCYRRIVKTTLCPTGDTSNRVCVTVRPDAKALFSAGKTSLCAPANTDSFITVTAFDDRNLKYDWYQNNILVTSSGNAAPPSFVIATPGEDVAIKLITSSLFGCNQDSMSVLFKTIPSVTARFTKDAASGCGPLTVNFTNSSTLLDNSIAFFWDFGNGTSLSNVAQPAPVVFEPSADFTDTTYYITLKAFSGCDTSYMKDSVKVFANPKARFTSKEIGCSPFRDTIINNSFGTDAFSKFYWDFGDNTSTTTTSAGPVYHSYNTGIVDTFTIRLIAENRCKSDTQSMKVVVSPNVIQPRFSINGNEVYGCAPHAVTFQNSSLGASVLSFDFGDGSLPVSIANSESEITHTYADAGDYVVNIKLQNSCTDTSVVQKINVYTPPVASFTIARATVCDKEAILTENNSADANSYQWLWGDNTKTPGLNPSHVYSEPGVYSVQLLSSRINAFGVICTDTFSMPVTVVARIPAIISVNPENSCVPYTLKVSADGAENAGKVDWVFYDSNIAPGTFYASGKDASYTYTADGTNSVKVVVTNAAGCADSATKQFTVHKTPSLEFQQVNVKTCNPDTSINFNVNPVYSGSDPLKYEWFINDTLSGNSNPFIYQFIGNPVITATTPYEIKVAVKNSFGCGDTSVAGNVTIQTLSPQHIRVLPSAVQQQPNYTFTFQDTEQGSPNSTYLWYTGDRNGQQLPGRDITYTYGDTGRFLVKLLVSDVETGCSQSDSISVFVLGVPGYLYVPNAFCPGCHKAELRQFLPLGKGLKDYHLVIFNTWGQKVFETKSLDANGVPNQPWNGNWDSSKNTQQGAFSWYIEAHYINGSEWKGMLNPKTNRLEKQGFLSIIR